MTMPTGPDLPFPTPPFGGTLGRLIDESEPSRPEVPLPAPDAPNIVIVLLDDVGFGTCGTFGGPVPTPALDRVGTPRAALAVAAIHSETAPHRRRCDALDVVQMQRWSKLLCKCRHVSDWYVPSVCACIT